MQTLAIISLYLLSSPIQEDILHNKTKLDTVFSFYLNILNNYVENPNSDSALSRMEAIRFFEVVTSKKVKDGGGLFWKVYY